MMCPFCYTVAYQNNGHFYSIQETLVGATGFEPVTSSL